jgi:CHAT domain-containing protein/pimeloyl-ACP methyl ester carboxylesterase
VPENDPEQPISIRLPGARLKDEARALPRLLQGVSRAAGGAADPFVNEQVVTVDAVYDLSAAARGAPPQATSTPPAAHKLLALEAEDGTTIFIRSDRLRDDLQRLFPEALADETAIDLSALRDREGAARGLGDWIWSRLTELTLGPDAIIGAATDKAREWVLEKLGEVAIERLEAAAGFSASTLGAKALMWAIESNLPNRPGLYHWRSETIEAADLRRTGDPRLAEAAESGPLLVFVHGTGSSTAGSFRDLRATGTGAQWQALTAPFADRVYGFEHRTFSESPIDNALALAQTLPKGAHLGLVTHSRGGLVGDLLCLGGLDDELIGVYRTARQVAIDAQGDADQRALQEAVVTEELDKLRRLRDLLAERDFRIERYVRVACPAGGTRLLSDNLEVFLSGLLSLTSAVIGTVAGPAASPVLSAFKRVVLEIADKRLEPQLVPGIEAMLPESPLGMLLARAPRKQGVTMAVIAGDIEGQRLLKRVAVMFTDWMFFDRVDNDLVVDTDSMYAGLARTRGSHALFDQGPQVDHFSYFSNRRTREALGQWLTHPDPTQVTAFSPLEQAPEPSAVEVRARSRQRAAARRPPEPDTRPVVVVLPGIMGSHLALPDEVQAETAGDRVWFDFLDILRGGIGKLRYGARDVAPEAIFELFYGDLAEHLEASHSVIRFPYDWRRPVQATADDLAATLEAALTTHPSQPVRLLAHSMGGLVARAMIARRPELWHRLVDRPGGRLVMLGTPNNGSHEMVAALLGKAETIRKLARIDLAHPMQALLDIIAGFPGAIQLLPRPGFRDSGNTEGDYLDSALWEGYRQDNRDRWFGDGRVGVPDQAVLDPARALWAEVLGEPDAGGGPPRTRRIDPIDRISYVYGKAEATPCGIVRQGGRLKLQSTPEGDGRVSWAAGRLDFLPPDRCWYMPVEHGNLTDTAEHFPAILELLQTGATRRLGRLPIARGAGAIRTYDAGPVPYPSEEEVERSLLGSRPRRRVAPVAGQRLSVRVMAMDLRDAQLPVLCGHYLGDPIAGAESRIDAHLVDGALRQRERLGVYAGELGSSAVVLMHRSREEARRGTGKGAVIVGLGEMGRLTADDVTETVRAGVLQYLLHSTQCDQPLAERTATGEVPRIGLASVLIGHNSTTSIAIEDSIDAIVLGVCEANRQFAEVRFANTSAPALQVGELVLMELFLDTAISAAHALRGVPRRRQRELRRLGVQVEPSDRLTRKAGARERLSQATGFGYWARILVTNADRPDVECPSECYQEQRISPIPEAVRRELVAREGADSAPARPGGSAEAGASAPTTSPALAERLKFVYLSARARAESLLHQRQPGLADKLVEQAVGRSSYDADLGRTLFQLLVPLQFKQLAREADRLVLVVDSDTANIPWEMLQAGDEPMVLKTAVVRQLVAMRYRTAVRSTVAPAALIISNPSTARFHKHFGEPSDPPLADLSGAVEEGEVVREILEAAHYQVAATPPDSKAIDVFANLFRQPYRILMIAAHGVFRARTRDGGERTGVVLSDGVLLTAAEVRQMEVVPEVVFLNCCHLGTMDPSPVAPNRLAYSLARELIEMGVRCVVAAGWAVDDQAAKTFAQAFFDAFVQEAQPFGDAVHRARQQTYAQHRGVNTWGAYQAYGDPGFRLERREGIEAPLPEALVAPEEVVAALRRLRTEAGRRDDLAKTRERVTEVLRAAPAEWADRPDVQAAIGALYAEFGHAGFEAARTAYLRAIAGEQAEEDEGALPVRVIEQLANLEARTAMELGHAKGMDLIEQAIDRLRMLVEITAPPTRAAGAPGEVAAATVRPNQERGALLGGALKRKALLQMDGRAQWPQIQRTLTEARNAYARVEGSPDDPGFKPYAMLNRLQLDAVLREPDEDPGVQRQLAARCEAAARRRFSLSYDFWDAVSIADAQLTDRLLAREVVGNEDELRGIYTEATGMVPRSARELDSMVRQICTLARCFAARGARDVASHLAGLADLIEPSAPCALPASGTITAPTVKKKAGKTTRPKAAKRGGAAQDED